MPRFDFLCSDCASTFEHLLPRGAPPPACLHCGSTQVQKLLAPPPVIFKGSGFYKTDSIKKETDVKKTPEKEPKATAEKTKNTEKTPPQAKEGK